MNTLNGQTDAHSPSLEIRQLDPVREISQQAKNYICVRTTPDPENKRKTITNVVCCYSLSGFKVCFRKNPIDSDESFEDAMNWAKNFAQRHGIGTIYASNYSVPA